MPDGSQASSRSVSTGSDESSTDNARCPSKPENWELCRANSVYQDVIRSCKRPQVKKKNTYYIHTWQLAAKKNSMFFFVFFLVFDLFLRGSEVFPDFGPGFGQVRWSRVGQQPFHTLEERGPFELWVGPWTSKNELVRCSLDHPISILDPWKSWAFWCFLYLTWIFSGLYWDL